MPTRYDIAKRLYGARSGAGSSSTSSSVASSGGINGNGSSSLTMRYGTAVADSADGWVDVKLDTTDIVSDDGTTVHCACDTPIYEGQRVCVLFSVSGNLKAIPIGDAILDEMDGQIGNMVVNSDIEWAGSDSGDTAPTSGWSQSWPSGSLYVWQRQRIERKDGSVEYSAAVCISRPQEGYDNDETFYATSSTGSSTAAKVATVQDGGDFSLEQGVVVSVKFANANSASSPTLNVNSTGAKSIMTLGSSSAYWTAGQTVLFVYDGTYWQVASSPVWASTVTVGNPSSRNVYIDSSHVAIRNGTTEYATFDANSSTIGRSNSGGMIRIDNSGLSIYDAGDEVASIYADSDGATIETTYSSISLLNNNASSITLNQSSIILSSSGSTVGSRHSLSLPYNSARGYFTNVTKLYSNSNGTTGTVTLSMSASYFWKIDIYFSDGSRVQCASTCGTTSSSSIGSVSNRSVALTRAVASGTSQLYIAGQYVTISGTTISRSTCLQGGILSGSTALATSSFYIVAVVGWAL